MSYFSNLKICCGKVESVRFSRMFWSAPCCYANFNALLENISRMSGKMLRRHWACGWSDVLRWEQTPSLNSKRGHSLLLEVRLSSLFSGGLRQQLSPCLHCRESQHHMSRLTARLAFFFQTSSPHFRVQSLKEFIHWEDRPQWTKVCAAKSLSCLNERASQTD